MHSWRWGSTANSILVLPKLDVVAVMDGNHGRLRSAISDDGGDRPESRRRSKSDKALPADAEAEALLNAAIRNAATEKPDARVAGATARPDDLRQNLALRQQHAPGTNAQAETDCQRPDLRVFGLLREGKRAGTRSSREPIGLDGVSRGKRQSFARIANIGVWVDDAHVSSSSATFLRQGQIYYWSPSIRRRAR